MSLEEEEDFDPVPPSLDIESRELSRGSYGVVYRGRLGEKSVAVKRIHPVLLREEGSECLLKVFKNECRYLKILDHPNVVRFMGAFRDKEGPLLVMELMEENLETFLKRNRGTLSFRRQLEICNSIAKGLFFLHNCKEPIIHRDLSDRNILLAEDGTAKIADFGQSKLIDKPSKILMGTRQPGAVFYMPPEVLKKEPRYTNTVDTFSLGVLMLEIATQQQPQVEWTEGRTKTEVIRRAEDLNLLNDDHLLKPLIIWCLQQYQCRPSASAVYNQLTALSDTERLHEKIKELQEDKGRMEKEFARQYQKYAVEKEAWFLLVEKLKDEKTKLEVLEQMQQTKNAEVEKSELVHVKCERLEVEKSREAITELEIAGIRESQKKEIEKLLMRHQEELQLLKDELLEKHKEAIAIEIEKRSKLEQEVKQLQQEKEQLKLPRKPIIPQAPVPRARSNTNPVASQVPQGHEPTSQDRTDISSTIPRRSKPSSIGPKPGYMDDREKKFKRHAIVEGVNISGYPSPVAPVKQVMGQTKVTSPPPVKPKPKKGT